MPTSASARPGPSPLDKQLVKSLRQRAHALRPVIRLGQHGLTEAVLAELERAIEHHGLIKVKLAAENAEARQAQVDALLEASRATLVQRIGHIATLYREPVNAPAAPRSNGPAQAGARRRVGTGSRVSVRTSAPNGRARRR